MSEIQLARIIDVAEKILRETLRLRLDVLKVADRLECFEDEEERFKSLVNQAGNVRRPRSATEALAAIGEACRTVRDVEYDVSACRAKLTEIAGDPLKKADFAREGIVSPHKAEAEKIFGKGRAA